MLLNDTYSSYKASPTVENYELLGAALIQYIRRLTLNAFKRKCRSEEIADIEGDALVHVLESLPTFKGESTFATWVSGVIENRGRNLVRAESRKAASPLFDADVVHDPSLSISNKLLLDQLIDRLDTYDKLFSSLKLRGYTNVEVAERLNIPVGTVDRQWSEIQAKLRTLGGGE